MNILALDLATRTGWAAQLGGRVESGAECFEVRRGESPGMRYLVFNRWLASICSVVTQNEAGRPCVHDLRDDWCAYCGFCPVQLIVYEQTVPGIGGIAREIAAGFATRVQEFCAIHKLEHTAVYPSTLKKWTTGKGNADKVAMLEAVARRFGRRVDDHNEADAVALLHYALSELVPAGSTQDCSDVPSRDPRRCSWGPCGSALTPPKRR